MTTVHLARRPGAVLATAALLLGGALAPGAAAASVTATGHFESNLSLAPPLDFAAPTRNGFPVDLGKPLGNPNPSYPFTGLWVYADEAGKVRTYASTGSAPGWVDGKVFLVWEKALLKGGPADVTRFTVNKSWLDVAGDLLGRNGEVPYAELEIEVSVWPMDRGPLTPSVALHYRARIDVGLGGLQLTYAESTRRNHPWTGCGPDAAASQGGPATCGPGFDGSDDQVPSSLIQKSETELRLETHSYTDTLDLSGIRPGAGYVVQYKLHAAAAALAVEAHAEAFIGDPLDPAGGITLETTSLPLDPGRPPRLCRDLPDDGRWTDGLDGTVTDRYTGLVWRRCPQGYTLDAASTPTLADDRCTLAGTRDFTWQGALQAAVGDGTGGHLDWRVPNLKELASIVAPGCALPAIEPDPFPDTPPDLFWTSTPGPGAAESRAVHFGTGVTERAARSGLALVRLVRTGPPPVAPLPGLRLLRPPPVREGDAGTVDLVFPVVLDRAAAADVTVAYQTFDLDAVAGQDYQATSGTLVLPAGATAGEIRVPVLGDALGEPDETLALVLSHPSANARLLQAAQVGRIVDDEPRLSAWPAEVLEGDAGTSELRFPVTLSKPAAAPVTVAWATSDGSATAGADYLAAAGTLTFAPGETLHFASVTVLGDGTLEGDETLLLTLSAPSANAALGTATAVGLIADDDRPLMAGWSDTGVTTCADATFYNLTCPVAGFPRQDGDVGRNTLAFTKLDAAGLPLGSGATAWACVRDDVTGLTWEVHPDDGGPRDRDWTYTWFRSSGIDDGGAPGSANGGTCVDTSSCDTEKYAAAVNAAGLCGASDWRLPTWEELRSLNDMGNSGGTPNLTWFNDPPPRGAPGEAYQYWTATSVASDGTRAVAIQNLAAGSGLGQPKSSAYKVRLVRGGL